MDLADVFNMYGSDKDVNGYTPLYYSLFDRRKDDALHVAEIGIGTMIPGAHSSMVGYALSNYKPGGSLRAWRDYFRNGQLYGFDVQPDTQFEEERIKTFLCNSTSADEVQTTMKEIGVTFDIIIDDGDHYYESQLKTLRNFYPYLRDGGIYVIEDICLGSPISTNPRLVQDIIGKDALFFSGVKNNLCVIYKKPLHSVYRNY